MRFILPLLVSRGIIELHGGKIGIQSDGEGHGSTFYFELPISNEPELSHRSRRVRKKEEEGKEPNLISALRSSSSIAPSNNNDEITLRLSSSKLKASLESRNLRNVLITDDSISNRKMLSRLLLKQSFIIDEASDGAEAVEKVKAARLSETTSYNIILMDFVMPNMDGPTATRKIRELGFNGVIIGITGNALPEDVRVFLASGADKVMPKPLNMSEFMEAMKGAYKL